MGILELTQIQYDIILWSPLIFISIGIPIGMTLLYYIERRKK